MAALCLGAAPAPTDDVLLFTYFRDNGQAGVFLAQSADGITFAPLNGDRPIFTPPRWPGQVLTRDATILYREGVFRIVWTSHWKGRVFGYAESRDPGVTPLPGRNLRLTFTGPDLDQPNFTPVSAPIAGTHSPMFSHPDALKSMAEGQSLLRYRDQWWLYWDEPAGQGMQLGTSPDLVVWTHVKALKFPAGAKHGTAFLAPRAAVGWLKPTPVLH